MDVPHDTPEVAPRPSSISPEMAERLLSADLKNIVKKVADGKTLSPSELNRVKSIASGSNTKQNHLNHLPGQHPNTPQPPATASKTH